MLWGESWKKDHIQGFSPLRVHRNKTQTFPNFIPMEKNNWADIQNLDDTSTLNSFSSHSSDLN